MSIVRVQNLEFSYEKSNKNAVDRISFNMEKGDIFGFLGPSGAGKTTTQRILIGLLRDYRGSVELMGKERKIWGNDFYEKIGVAFDFPNLYLKLSAKENLELIASYYKQRPSGINNLLDRVGLLPYKDKKVEGFSKGMKARLNFIRSVMHDPEILFFDEPTSGLDPVNSKIVKDMILELKSQGKTVFLTTHNMTAAEQLCDRVAFIVEGKISVIDSPKNLMIKYGNPTVRIEFFEDMIEKCEEFKLEGINKNEKFFNVLKSKQIKTIHSQETTLEDIFIKLTGRQLI